MITKEDKELLLKDLCARLPYGVKARVYNHWSDDVQDETITIENLHQLIKTFSIEDIKPYLFPLSSMTEEQKKEDYDICKEYIIGYESNLIDFYNKYHLDYRGLIEKGLAIDATGLNIY
jgi:hypothetical protein